MCLPCLPARISPFLRQFANSVFYSGSVAFGTVLSCSLAAYSFGCLRWRGRNLVFGLTIVALLIPPIVTFLPIYIAWSKLGLNGTYWPLIAPSFLGDAFLHLHVAAVLSWCPARADGRREAGRRFRVPHLVADRAAAGPRLRW